MKSFEFFSAVPEDDLQIPEPETPKELELKEKLKEVEEMARELFVELNSATPQLNVIKRILSSLDLKISYTQISIREEFGASHPEDQNLKTLRNKADLETNSLFQKLFDEEMFSPVENDSELDMEQVEKTAHYEGDKTLLLIERLTDQEINNQLTHLLYLDRKYDLNIQNAPSRDEVKQTIINNISSISKDTPITFTGEMPGASDIDGVRENMDIFWKSARVFGENGDAQKNITEAHEKGHTVRKIRSSAAKTYFKRALDFTVMKIPEDRLKEIIQFFHEMEVESPAPTDAEVHELIILYLSNPMEVAERMSQLKNYFGIADNSVFTKEHLKYAREHYVEDSKLDNHMTEFFQCITPETEDMFIKIINNAGI